MPESFRYYGSLQVDQLTDSKRASPPTALRWPDPIFWMKCSGPINTRTWPKYSALYEFK